MSFFAPRNRVVALARGLVIAGGAAAGVLVAPGAATAASVCYQLPFPNPNLADGWGSTCCGRTSPHRGVDFPQPNGKAIPAAAEGKVVVNTYSGCLGNVIVLQHADGMYSGYCHMNAASSLKKGASVKKGQTVGKVGSTGKCANGAHLHLTMSATAGGYASGATVDPYKYIQKHLTCNKPPEGALLGADCQEIVGWTRDPDVKKEDITARLAFDGKAGDDAVEQWSLTAELERDDLCDAIETCDHGFAVPTPISLFDGGEHEVRAYGLDGESDKATELKDSPRSFTCAPDLEGERRHVFDAAALAAWQFSPFFDTLALDDTLLASLGVTIDLPTAPLLVRADDGSPEIWLIDGVAQELRRHVPSTAAAKAWHLDLAGAVVWPADQLAALVQGPPLRRRPVLVRGSGPDIYVLDEHLDLPAGDESSGGSESSGGGTGVGSGGSGGNGGSGESTPTSGGAPSSGPGGTSSGTGGLQGLPGGYGVDEGCGCRSAGGAGGWPGVALLLLLAPRRRRR